MTPREFLITLEEELKYLPKNKRTIIINIYQEKINTEIDLGTPEDKIVSLFLDPKLIAEDIYQKEGIDYIERRKRKLKSDDIFKMIVSSLLMLLTFSAAIVLTGLIGYSIFQLIKLITMLKGAKELIFMSLLGMFVIMTSLLIYLYLIDIFILIFNFLLDKILIAFDKKLNFVDFSIVDFIEEKIKKTKILKKLLITAVIGIVVMIAFNIVLKTYLYRSYFQEKPTNYTEKIDLNQYLEQTDIKLIIDEANTLVKQGDNFVIKIISEFPKDIKIQQDNNQLIINTDTNLKFDMFNFLKEPNALIEITIPNNKNINVVMNNGVLEVKDLAFNESVFDLQQGNLIINNVFTKKSYIKIYNGGVNILNSLFEEANLTISLGQINFEKCTFNNLNIKNQSADTIMKEVIAPQIDFKANGGNANLEKITSDNLSVNVSSGNVSIKDIKCSNKIKMLSESSASFSLKNAVSKTTEVITITGDVIFDNVESTSSIETGSRADLNKIKGDFSVNCLGNFLNINEAEFTTAKIQTRQTEVSMKFLKGDKIEYIGMDSMTTLYFVFCKNISITDPAGNTHIDNAKLILKNDEEKKLYDKYYQKVEIHNFSGNVTYRDTEGVVY